MGTDKTVRDLCNKPNKNNHDTFLENKSNFHSSTKTSNFPAFRPCPESKTLFSNGKEAKVSPRRRSKQLPSGCSKQSRSKSTQIDRSASSVSTDRSRVEIENPVHRATQSVTKKRVRT